MRAADSALHGLGLGFGFHCVRHTLRAWRVLRPPDVLMIGEEFQRRRGMNESPLGDQGEHIREESAQPTRAACTVAQNQPPDARNATESRALHVLIFPVLVGYVLVFGASGCCTSSPDITTVVVVQTLVHA